MLSNQQLSKKGTTNRYLNLLRVKTNDEHTIRGIGVVLGTPRCLFVSWIDFWFGTGDGTVSYGRGTLVVLQHNTVFERGTTRHTVTR